MSFRDAYIGIGFPGNLVGQESVCSVGETGDKGSILGSIRSPGEGHENPLQCSRLENYHGEEEPGGLLSEGSHRIGHY